MQPNCKICGQFIPEHDLWDAESVECCEEHGFIKCCGSCLELFEKYAESEDKCIIRFVRDYRPTLNTLFHARHACPQCDYISFSFSKTSNHMASKNHLYQGVGTYPIFVAPHLKPHLPHSSESIKKLALQRPLGSPRSERSET